MIYDNQAELRDRIAATTHRRPRGDIPVLEDTSNYVALTGGMVLRIAASDYFILGEATEGRFGINEQPKFWVKHAVDLETGGRKVIKLVFHEEFSSDLGFITVRCRRSPEKESAILDLVEGDHRFMQGFTARDPSGNSVRIIDFIRGPTFFNSLSRYEEQSHEAYYYQTLPGLLAKLVDSVEALAFLHERGLEHGDVRNDHIIIETDTDHYRWIDFDYAVNYSDYDVFSMGNILTYAVAGRIITCRDAADCHVPGQQRCPPLQATDSLMLRGYRLANLKAIYPYIDDALNDLLLRFSNGASDFFADFPEMTKALRAAIIAAFGPEILGSDD